MMSRVAIAGGGLTALCLCGYGSSLATVLGAFSTSPVDPVPRKKSEEPASTDGHLSLPRVLFSTLGAAGAAALLYKGGNMIEAGARTSWSLGAVQTSRDFIDLSTLMKCLAGLSLGWQGVWLFKSFSSPGRAHREKSAESESPTSPATEHGMALTQEGEDALVQTALTGLGLAVLGGGMVGALWFRIPEETFDDVLLNARLSVAASLMGGGGLGMMLRLGKNFHKSSF
ncbi:hypothetical protein CSUI_001632 [Cystoisospora suis]|uniref:Transmembrane protein n=1 Tax=Cystoisospora suis TaxID=483139 RepID=A0A2C6LC29_9APIC|nr:hypothetical protein CSUI_001632 [Cystoisospora suis]